MKKFDNVEISKVERICLNGRMTNVYEVREIDGNARIFAGRFSGQTYEDAYNAYLNAECEALNR